MKDALAASPVTLVFDHYGNAKEELGVEQHGFSDLVSLVKSGKTGGTDAPPRFRRALFTGSRRRSSLMAATHAARGSLASAATPTTVCWQSRHQRAQGCERMAIERSARACCNLSSSQAFDLRRFETISRRCRRCGKIRWRSHCCRALQQPKCSSDMPRPRPRTSCGRPAHSPVSPIARRARGPLFSEAISRRRPAPTSPSCRIAAPGRRCRTWCPGRSIS